MLGDVPTCASNSVKRGMVLGFKVSGVPRLTWLQHIIVKLENLAQILRLAYKAKLISDQGKFA
jgi:hypothetical protein